MILDSGICSIFRKVNTAEAGKMPVFGYVLLTKGWFGKLEFSSVPSWQTDSREETQVEYRIRILQNTAVNNHDAVILSDTDSVEDGMTVYEVVKAFHGTEDGTGTQITDLSLEVVQP